MPILPYACDHIIWRAATMATAQCIHIQHNAHTLDSHICSHPHTHISMHAHACMLSRPPRTAMRHYIRSHHPHRTPQYTLHLHIPSAVQPHTHAHCNTPNTQHIATLHTQLRTVCACHRDHDETGDNRQHRHTHITPTAITTTMTMCDDM